MTARDKFLALATVIIAIPIVGKVAPGVAIMMAIGLLTVLYLAWKEMNRR